MCGKTNQFENAAEKRLRQSKKGQCPRMSAGVRGPRDISSTCPRWTCPRKDCDRYSLTFWRRTGPWTFVRGPRSWKQRQGRCPRASVPKPGKFAYMHRCVCFKSLTCICVFRSLLLLWWRVPVKSSEDGGGKQSHVSCLCGVAQFEGNASCCLLKRRACRSQN